MNFDVTHKGEKLAPMFEKYLNGNTAITMITTDGEQWCTATINVEPMRDDEVVIKDYSENEGIEDALIESGYIKPTGRKQIVGMTKCNVCKILKTND